MDGCQAKPTVLRTPCAKTSHPVPSGFIRVMEANVSSFEEQMLHGAPTGT